MVWVDIALLIVWMRRGTTRGEHFNYWRIKDFRRALGYFKMGNSFMGGGDRIWILGRCGILKVKEGERYNYRGSQEGAGYFKTVKSFMGRG